MVDQPTFSSSEAQYALQQALLGFLATLPDSLASAVKLGAIPQWFDEPLLTQLIGNHAQASLALAEFSGIYFIQRDPSGRFTYQPTIRSILLDELRQNEPDRFIDANRVALVYLQELSNQAPTQEALTLKRQVIYHQLILDEKTGLDLLCTSFEEAYDWRQLGTMENILTQTSELRYILSEAGRSWLRYFTARLDLANRRNQSGAAVFSDLSVHSQVPLLRALAVWSLGRISLDGHQWTQAIKQFQESLSMLKSEQAGLYTARLQLSIGDAYLDLAQNSGSVEFESWRSVHGFQRSLEIVLNFPFLVIEWLMRRVDWLPDGWYVGINYQDWIIFYLLDMASRWYRRARNQFQHHHDPRGLVETLLPLARIEFLKNRWSRAEKNYRALLQEEHVIASPYRTARVLLGQAELYNQRGKLEDANRVSQQAMLTFQRFGSHSLAAAAADQLAQSDYRRGELDKAGQAFLTSLRAYQEAGEPLKSTPVIWELEHLSKEPDLSAETEHAIVEAVKQTTQRAYLARFPDRLMHWFRRLALWAALPLAYLLVLLTGIALFLGTVLIEDQLAQIYPSYDPKSIQLSVILPILAFTLLPFLLSFWFYRLFYSLMGLAMVHLLGRGLVRIEREQPESIETLSDELVIGAQGQEKNRSWAWGEINGLAEVNYRIWKHPIQLISGLLLTPRNHRITLKGSTRGYTHMREDVASHLHPAASHYLLDFIILGSPWTLVALLFSLGFAIFTKQQLGWYVSFGDRELLFAPIFLFTYLLMLFIYTSVTLWRLAIYRLKITKILGVRKGMLPIWIFWLAAFFSTLLTGGFLLFLTCL